MAVAFQLRSDEVVCRRWEGWSWGRELWALTRVCTEVPVEGMYEKAWSSTQEQWEGPCGRENEGREKEVFANLAT